MAARLASPRREVYEVAGRAGPVERCAEASTVAKAREDLLVIRADDVFLCARACGNVHPGTASGEGLYGEDTRHLSELMLAFGAVEPVLLDHSVESGYRAVVHATNPQLTDARGAEVPRATLNLRRTLLVAGGLYCSVTLHNFHAQPVAVPLRLSLAADSRTSSRCAACARAPRAASRWSRARTPPAWRSATPARTACSARRWSRSIRRRRPARDGQRVTVDWQLELRPGAEQHVTIRVALGGDTAAAPRRRPALASRALDDGLRTWVDGCTRIETDNELFQRASRTSRCSGRTATSP